MAIKEVMRTSGDVRRTLVQEMVVLLREKRGLLLRPSHEKRNLMWGLLAGV
jgi:hypothetical protein